MENAFLGVLWVDHVGRKNAISADDLAVRFAGRLGIALITKASLEEWKRDVRELQNHLLFDHSNIPVLSAAGRRGGYWMAETEAEGRRFEESFRKRAKTGFLKATRGRRGSMVDMVTQLTFEWEDLVDKSGMPVQVQDNRAATPIEVVDAFLTKMLDDPDKFAQGLRQLGEKYGSVLVPRNRFDEIIAGLKAKSMELSALASALEH
jgi:hypothetical protein